MNCQVRDQTEPHIGKRVSNLLFLLSFSFLFFGSTNFKLVGEELLRISMQAALGHHLMRLTSGYAKQARGSESTGRREGWCHWWPMSHPNYRPTDLGVGANL